MKANKKEQILLEKLTKHYHTLPVVKEELKPLCQKIGVSSSQVYEILKKALENKLFYSTSFRGRTLIYLD